MANGAGDGINFTVKELILQVQSEVREVNRKLDTKADQSSLVDARNRLTALEREQDKREGLIKTIENKASQKQMDELDDKVGSLTKALYTASLSVVAAVLIFLVQQGGFH